MEEDAFNIESDPILRQFHREDIRIFVQDLFLVFNILAKMDLDQNNQTDKNISKFRSLMKEWELKYRDVILHFKSDSIECSIKIYFKDTFENAAHLIESMNRFKSMSRYTAQLDASFEGDKMDNTLTLKSESGLLRMIYLKEDMLRANSPEFKLCTFYAMKDGFDKSINLQKYSEAFSFDADNTDTVGWYKSYSDIRFPSWKR
jgi:hypothetical protein